LYNFISNALLDQRGKVSVRRHSTVSQRRNYSAIKEKLKIYVFEKQNGLI
jgi:hypothetical protein